MFSLSKHYVHITKTINAIFSTPERVKILETIVLLNGNIGVNTLAREVGLSKGFVSTYLHLLENEGVLKRIDKKFIINENSLLLKIIKMFLTIMKFDIKIFEKFKFIQAVGLYGSCAKGENRESSDVDIWIKISDASSSEQAYLSSELIKMVNNLNILFLNKSKLKILSKADKLFYDSLYFGSMLLYGDPHALNV